MPFQFRPALLAPIAVLATTVAFAQTPADPETGLPPKDARKASEIVAQIEQRPDFRYLESLDWDEDGYYEVTYHTGDKAKVEIKIDPVTGKTRN